MRAALVSVDGVKSARVTFERHEAQVEYDPSRCGVEDLISAVAQTTDPAMPVKFGASVKK